MNIIMENTVNVLSEETLSIEQLESKLRALVDRHMLTLPEYEYILSVITQVKRAAIPQKNY